MQEVIGRRLARYEQEKDIGRGFGRLPDLILLDGGQGHLNAVQPILDAFGLKVPMYGMVKDDRHRTRAIASDGGEISIAAHKRAFNLVTAIQDEVHRFSITYSRSKHRKSGLESVLTGIPGIGKTRAAALYRHFKTVKAISAAAEEELLVVPGMTDRLLRPYTGTSIRPKVLRNEWGKAGVRLLTRAVKTIIIEDESVSFRQDGGNVL